MPRRGHVAHGPDRQRPDQIVTRGPSTDNTTKPDPPAPNTRLIVIAGDTESGEAGRPGRAGRDGADGRPGPPGRDGRDGADGADGRQGRDGAAGVAGAAGADGARGARGWDGADGEDGQRVVVPSSFLIGAGGFLEGSGHPQGVAVAPLGWFYRDRTTGYLYRKLGGGTSAWGWYIERQMGAPHMYFDYFTINGSWVGVGITNGTGTASGTQSRGFFSEGVYFQNATGAAANATSTYSGDASTTAMLRCTHDWDIVIPMRTDSADITGTRMIIGVATVNVNLASAAPTASGIWFRYDTVAGDSQWMGYAHDGTTLSGTTAIGAIAAATAYKLRIRKVGSTAYLSINDAAEVTLSNNVPVGAVTVGPMMRVTTTGGAKALWSWYHGVRADFKGA